MLYTCSDELKTEMKSARARTAASTRIHGKNHPNTAALTKELNRLQCIAHFEGSEPLVHTLTDTDVMRMIETLTVGRTGLTVNVAVV